MVSQHLHLRGEVSDFPRGSVWCEVNHARPNYAGALIAFIGAHNLEEDGSLPRTLLGCTGDLYYMDGESNTLCATCASKVIEPFDDGSFTPQDRIVAAGDNMDDPDLYCDDCSERIASGS